MQPVQVGQPAPPFTCTAVVDGRIKELSLSSYTDAKHWVVLIFFPKAWSFVCPTEVKAFSARLEEFLWARSCAVVFASTDSEYALKAWNGTCDLEGGLGGVHVPLISDSNHKLSRDYGVLVEESGTAQRALFIIDPKGIIRGITINDADVGRSVEETQRILDALAFKDEFGEGCPVDWKRGDRGIELAPLTVDLAPPTKTEATVEARKSWSEWARPKLHRTWSASSARSINSAVALGNSRLRADSGPHSRSVSGDRLNPITGGSHLAPTSVPRSPLIRPASGFDINGKEIGGKGIDTHLESAISQQRLENMQAAMQNHRLEQNHVKHEDYARGVSIAN